LLWPYDRHGLKNPSRPLAFRGRFHACLNVVFCGFRDIQDCLGNDQFWPVIPFAGPATNVAEGFDERQVLFR
jgi:hypothetical protein